MSPLQGLDQIYHRLTRRDAPGYYISPLRGFPNTFLHGALQIEREQARENFFVG